ncbi:hypothetical protein GCM10012275_62430 [Longimycelium tulufanense]|uniref:Uncharacterized protein n=1 Tax=Longimycelium tulufanense TaxID=907463 RepID=A0A8J3CKP5_9PSEU|nr:hypothetical protein [Longimycelium tulufanense]GGM83334.1 hypothetical protein GCM10012275_62430 [Longimycelium tulufanense]
MRIRVEGPRGEVEQALTRLPRVFTVCSVSRFYPHRGPGDCGRVDVEITPPPAPPDSKGGTS